VSGGHQEPAKPSNSPSTPDSGASDQVLLTHLQNELSVVQQDPAAYPSAWATALGVPRDITFGATAPNPGGVAGGFRVSPAQLQDWISELQAILSWTVDREYYIRAIEESQAPAPDSGSILANSAFIKAGNGLRRSNNAIREHVGKLIAVFKASLQAYQDTEQSNRSAMRSAGEGH
jgi:hypothetical protein